MKKVQVFDWLKMPHSISEKVAEFFEAGNGSYHRWYPRDDWQYPGAKLKEEVNKWLLENGMEVDKDDKYFYVLIYVSW